MVVVLYSIRPPVNFCAQPEAVRYSSVDGKPRPRSEPRAAHFLPIAPNSLIAFEPVAEDHRTFVVFPAALNTW